MKNIFVLVLLFACSIALAQTGTLNRIGGGNNSNQTETQFGGSPPMTLPSTIAIFIDTLGEDSLYVNNSGTPVFLEPGAPKYTVPMPDDSGPLSGTAQTQCGGEYLIDARSADVTVNPPPSGTLVNGCAFTVDDHYDVANDNWITIDFFSSSQKFRDEVQNYIFNHNGHKARFIWNATEQSWSTESEN